MELNEFRFESGQLEFLAKQVVEGFIIGLHKSPFHGFSVEFAEHRVYNSGDNLKHVDWKVLAKSDKMFVKKYEEETNLRCCLAWDVSASMQWSNGKHSKMEFAALAVAAIMQLLRKQLDAFGVFPFTDQVLHHSPIKSSERHYRDMMIGLEEKLAQGGAEGNTNLPQVLDQLASTLHPRGLVIVFSDIIDDESRAASFFEAIQHLRFMKQEVIIFQIGDAAQEWQFNFENRPYEFVDLETKERVKLRPNEVKQEYLTSRKAFQDTLAEKCVQLQIDLVTCDINQSLDDILRAYLLKRNKLM